MEEEKGPETLGGCFLVDSILPSLSSMELEARPPESTESLGQPHCSVLTRLSLMPVPRGVCRDLEGGLEGLHTLGDIPVMWGTKRLSDLPIVTCLGIKAACLGLGFSDS